MVLNRFFKFASNAMGRLVNGNRFMSNCKDKENMETFKTIRFKRDTAKRFQQFSKTHYKTHSEAMEGMLDFFFYNEISPKENLGPSIRTLEALIKKRINGLVAIIKDIEKNQTKPTAAMLLSLLEQDSNKKPLLIEKKRLQQSDFKIKPIIKNEI